MKKEPLQLRLGTVCAVLFIALFANRSEAHYVPTLSGWVYHSLECAIVLKNMPKQGEGGLIECSLPSTVATVFCRNPGGFVFAGKAALPSINVGEPIPSGGGASKDGKTYSASFNVFEPVLSDFQFACPGQGSWSVEAVVIQSFEGTITVTDFNGVVASQVIANCVIPPQFANAIPPSPTQYICSVITQHLN